MITIEGTTYVERPKPHPNSNAFKANILLTMTKYGATLPKTRGEIDCDIVKEYELILQKKSKLSFNQRKYVEDKFTKTYMPITDIDLSAGELEMLRLIGNNTEVIARYGSLKTREQISLLNQGLITKISTKSGIIFKLTDLGKLVLETNKKD